MEYEVLISKNTSTPCYFCKNCESETNYLIRPKIRKGDYLTYCKKCVPKEIKESIK